MARRAQITWALVLAPVLLFAVMTPRPAMACSCAEPTLQEIVDREPDAAVAVVRRIDRDAGVNGVGLVERRLRGALPDQVPLMLDDGGSCRPYLGVGQVATLSFEPAGDSWQTMDCGMLSGAAAFAAAFGPLRVDPGARGDPAVALGGGMPGAGVALLDSELAVLAVADIDDVVSVDACGDGLLVTATAHGRTVVSRLALPRLKDADAPVKLGGRQEYQRIIDVECRADGRVSAIVASEGQRTTLLLYRDLFGGRPRTLPAADDAVFAGDQVLLLHADNDGRRSVLAEHDIASGQTREQRRFDGLAGFSLDASPDGRHALLRGYAEESVLLVLDAASGAIVARSGGSWMPPEDGAWLNPEHLILIDENRAMGDAATGARIVDLRLAEVARLVPLTPTRLVAGNDMVAAVGGAELAIATPDEVPRVSDDIRTAMAEDVALLGPVAAAADRDARQLPEPEPGVEPPANPPMWLVLGLIAAVAMAAAVWRRARRTAENERP